MSALPVIALIGLTLFVWAVAIWSSIDEAQEQPEHSQQQQEEKPGPDNRSTLGKKVA
jgi:hypothetical protein